MLRFKQFINEGMSASKRVGITDLRKMKPLEFIDLMGHFQDEFKGKLTSNDLSFSLKVDGSPLRIGVDEDAQFFVETGKSGLMRTAKGIEAAIVNRVSTPKVLHMYAEFKKQKPVISYLQQQAGRHGGIKIIGELLYVPKAIADGDKLKFVSITYDKKKLGNLATFVCLAVVDGNGKPVKEEAQIINNLKRLSDGHINYDDANISVRDIDFSADIASFDNILRNYEDVARVLQSRKAVDKQVKDAIIDAVKIYQERFASKILSIVQDKKFGDEFEGLVLKTKTGKTLKIQSSDWSHK